jgi:hypothetical protein
MDHLLFDALKILVQSVVGPMTVAWLAAALSRRPKPAKRRVKKRNPPKP